MYSCAPHPRPHLHYDPPAPAVRAHHPPLCLGLEEELYRQMVHGPTRHLYRNEDSLFRTEGGLGERWDQRGGLE